MRSAATNIEHNSTNKRPLRKTNLQLPPKLDRRHMTKGWLLKPVGRECSESEKLWHCWDNSNVTSLKQNNWQQQWLEVQQKRTTMTTNNYKKCTQTHLLPLSEIQRNKCSATKLVMNAASQEDVTYRLSSLLNCCTHPVGLLHPAPCGIASHIFCHGLCYVSELMLWPNDCLFVHWSNFWVPCCVARVR